MKIRAQLPESVRKLLPGSVRSRVKRLFAPERVKPARRWNVDRADYPWFDQPNALELLEKRRTQEQLSDADYEHLRHWVTDGYCVISKVVPDQLIDAMLQDLDSLFTASRPIDGLEFHDLRLREDGRPARVSHAEVLAAPLDRRLAAKSSSNWRVHGLYKHSASARTIFNNAELRRLASLIMGRAVQPDFSINFLYGSSQELHQDSAVFHLVPPTSIMGAWIACEDISPDSGPLVFCPKSHHEPMFSGFDNYPQTNLRTATPELTRDYHRYARELGDKYGRKLFIARKGEVLLWHGMIVHGGSPIKNPQLTRKSYVLHYLPDGVDVTKDIVGPFNW